MAGIAVALITNRRELLAVVAGLTIAIVVGLAADPRVGVVAGALLGAGVALVAPVGEPEPADLPATRDPLP
jgi:hypothetical protein